MAIDIEEIFPPEEASMRGTEKRKRIRPWESHLVPLAPTENAGQSSTEGLKEPELRAPVSAGKSKVPGQLRPWHLHGDWVIIDDVLARVTPELQRELEPQFAKWMASERGKRELFNQESVTGKLRLISTPAIKAILETMPEW